MDDLTDERLDRLRKEAEKKAATNRETMKFLATRGDRVAPLEMMQLRLEVLVSSLLGNMESENRLTFEVFWQNALADLLSGHAEKATKAKLHIPGKS